jgi:hypothetical protein
MVTMALRISRFGWFRPTQSTQPPYQLTRFISAMAPNGARTLPSVMK